MTPERWAEVERLYHATLARDIGERTAFLREACVDNEELRREVELLLAQSASGDFLAAPAIAVAAETASTPGASVLTGRRIGVYQIHTLLGAGGMGEVYRARDTKLGRDVAVKVLPHTFTADPDRLARFKREARILASLNHPNIAAIYGFEDCPVEAGPHLHALVLELVEGDTLAERLLRGPVPVAEALTIARQVADALDAAHEKGIVHRDLKPANIKITPAGVVKVLDFGLAKLEAKSGEGAEGVSESPTITVNDTREGLIVGTAAYMSPEQARGQVVDKRTDIWAFGCVFYEMLTGTRAFEADDLSGTLARVLMTEPDWHKLPSSTPRGLRKLLQRCFEKGCARRLRDIGDARIELDEATLPSTASAATPSATLRPHWPLALTGLALVVFSVVLLLALRWQTAPPPATEVRLDVVPPGVLDPFSLALSPDGQQLVFVATDERGSRLWLRRLDQATTQPLPGTDGAAAPFWSPDSRAIGFFADGNLKRLNISGGPPRMLASAVPSASGYRGGSWSRADVILFMSGYQLFRIAANGGEAVLVPTLTAGPEDMSFPYFLPDGRRFLFTGGEGISLGSLDRAEPKRVAPGYSSVGYLPPGLVFYVRQGALVASRFDEVRGELVDGDSSVVADPVAVNVAGSVAAAFSVSAAGVVAYQAAGQRYRWTWLDRAGKAVGVGSDPSDVAPLGQDPALSPDGRRLAVTRSAQGNRDLWLIELMRGVATRLTFSSASDSDPIWSPDGNRIVFRSNIDLHQIPASGTGREEVLLESAQLKWPLDCSRDGRYLLYATLDPKTRRDLWVLPLTGDRKPSAFASTEFNEWNGQFSPDGRWIAYQSDQSGRDEVYVRPFPGPGIQHQLSTNGGSMPRWRRSGEELYFITPGGGLTAVPIRLTATTFDTGNPSALFQTRIRPTVIRSLYMVAADGRFLFSIPDEGGALSPITLILNWAGLKK